MSAAVEGDTSGLLERWSRGEGDALAGLIPRVHAELAGLARRYLRRERLDHTLETLALVNETYLRLAGRSGAGCRHRGELLALAATTMRRVLVDHARARRRAKRGAGAQRVPLGEDLTAARAPGVDLLALDQALERLAALAPEQVRVVELRCFGGLAGEEIAAVLGVSLPTVTRRWRAARAWLFRFLSDGDGDG